MASVGEMHWPAMDRTCLNTQDQIKNSASNGSLGHCHTREAAIKPYKIAMG